MNTEKVQDNAPFRTSFMTPEMEELLRMDPVDIRSSNHLSQKDKALTKLLALMGQGAVFSFFASVQTIMLLLKLTGDLSISWLYVPIPSALFAVIWYAINWSQKKLAEHMINEMKREIEEIKRSIR